MEGFSSSIAANYSRLGEFVSKNDLAVTGNSSTIFHTWEPPVKVVYQPFFYIESNNDLTSQDEILIGTTYAGKVIKTTHIGPYEGSAHWWEALDAYIELNQLIPNGSPWEEYGNTPQTESDPNKLVTHIFMPIE